MRQNYNFVVPTVKRCQTMSVKLKMITGLLFLLGIMQSFAQTNIANYSFATTTGATYTPITGGTALYTSWDSNVSSAITMGGTFPFGGSNMTTCYINGNGYITFGAASTASGTTPLSTSVGTGAIAAFAQDGTNSTVSGATPEIRYQNTGTEFVVQFKDHANWYNRTTERLNFQIRLTYATGAINIVYGSCTNPGTVSTSGTSVQVGIRGNSTTYASNVNALMAGNIPASTTCDWSNAVAAFSNSSTLLFSGTTNVNVKIPTGLTYTWTPGTQAPVRTFSAVTGIGSGGATVAWTAATGATGYNVQYRVPGTCAWTDWSGNPVATNTVSLTGLTPSTTYQVRVQAVNGSVLSPYSHIPNSAGSGDGYTATGTFTTASTTPTLSAGSLTAFGAQCINGTYGPNSFTLTGTNLTSADVVLAASAGYAYSTSAGGPFTSTLTLTPSAGSLNQTVHVQFSPTAVTTYNSNISISGGGASAITVTPSGSGVNTTPTESVTSAIAGNVTLTSASISGAVISALGCSSVTAYGIEYSTTSGFTGGTGTQVAGADFNNTAGGSFNATLSGLANSTTYYYRAYATNAGGTSYSGINSFVTLTANQIGAGAATSAYFPIYSNYVYNYSQQIYLASEYTAVVSAGQTYITKIRFRQVAAGTVANYNDWTVYMGNTSKSSFSTASDWIPLSSMSQVFTGTVTPVASTWMEITLTTPFLWDGTSNIVVAVDENKTGFSNSTWQSYTGSTNRSLLYYSDSVNPDPALPPTSGDYLYALSTNMAQIQFVATVPPNCLPVSGLSASATSYNAGSATWIAPTSGDTPVGYQWEVRTSGAAGSGATGLTTSGTPSTASATITGLLPNTQYSFYVRTNCGGTYSTWSSAVAFATEPITAIASGNFATGANWNNGTGPVCGQLAVIPNGMAMTLTSGTANTGSLAINAGGSLTVSGGTLTVGCTDNNTTLSNSGTLTVSGGTLAVNGNISNASGSTFNQSGGDIIIDGNDNFATATSVVSGTPMLGFGTSTTSFSTGSINMTGGAITFVDPHVATTAGSGYTIYAYLASGMNFDAAAAHTIKFGNGVSTQQGGNTNGFYYNLYPSSGRLNLGSVVVNNPSGTNRNFTQYLYPGIMNGDLTVTAGTYSQNALQTNIGGNLTVANGATYLATGSTYFCKSTGTGTTSAQTTAQSISVSGTGSIQNLASSPTANFTSLYIYNTSATGLTINPLNQVVANADVAASVSGTLTFNGKASTTSGKALLWGTAATQGGTLTITSGGMMPGSAFARGWTSGQTGSSIGTAGVTPTSTTSQFPLIDANGIARYAWIERTGGSAAGILAVTYTDGTGTDDVNHTDGSYTVDKRSKGKWTVSKLGTAIASTSYELAISAPSIFGALPSTAEARLLTASGFVGTYQLGNNTPHAQRILTDAQLTGGDFYMGINGNDLPYFSVQNGNWEDGTTWNKGVAPTSADNVTISGSTTVTAHTAAAVNAITVNTGGVLEVTSNALAVTNTITNNGTVNVAGGTLNVTSTATNGVANAGTFTLTSGTVNIGVTDNTFANRRFTNTGTLTVSGGTMNIYGNLVHSGTAFNQSGGNINIDGNANGTAANSVLASNYHLHITVPTTNWTGGTLTIVDPHNVDAAYVFYYSSTTTATDITSGTHTFRLGDGVSTTAGGTNGFNIYTWGSARFTFRNFEVNGGSATGRFARTAYGFGINGNLTINSASEFRDSALVIYVGGNVVNNGTYTSTGTLYLGTYVAGTAGASTIAQSIGGTGTYKNSLTTSTANLTSLSVNNTNMAGVTPNMPLSLSGTLTLTAGKVNTTNTNLLTLGTATTAGTLSGGSATAYIDGPLARTFAASKTSAAFGVANLFPVGKGTTYLPVNVDPVTTSGGAVVIKGEAFTSNAGTQGAGVISVSSKRWEALVTSGGANLTNAMVRLGDADIQNSDKILIASSADGEYHGIASAITYASGTPNTLSTVSTIDAADYTGYLSHGVLNACAAPANQPTALTLISKTTTTVTGSFTAAASAPSHYLVVAQPAANTPVAPVDFVTPTAASLGTGAIILYSGTATTFSGSSLTANTAYNIYVYSYNNSGCYGPVFNTTSPLTYNFTTCASNATSPGTVTASAITNNSYTATWTGPVGASYILEVATNTTFTNYVTGYNNVNIGAVTTTSITGLNQNATYYTRVRTLLDGCSSTNTGYTTVTTQMLMPAPHTEGFATATTPAGWTASSASVGSVRGVTGNPGNAISMNLYDDGDYYTYTGNFTTVNVGMLPANYQLTFDYKLANYSSPYAAPAAGSANFIVAISTNFGASYSTLETVVNDGTEGWKERLYDLSAYAGLPVKIRITGNYISSSYIDFDLAFDNFKFAPMPACSKITNVNVTNVTNATATLEWVPSTNGTPVSYSYEVRTSGAPGSGATGLITQGTVSAPALTTNIGSLTQLTTYTVYMRTLCTGSEYSEWTSGVQFTTSCVSFTVLPHNESFNAATIPTCWATSSTNLNWTPSTGGSEIAAPHSGSHHISVAWSSTLASEALLVSPPYNLTANPKATQVSIWFYRHLTQGLATDKLTMYVNNAPNITGATVLLELSRKASEAPAVEATGWYNYTATIPSSYLTGGTFYVIAKANMSTSASSYQIGIDDYALEYVPAAISNFTPAQTCSLAGETFTITGTHFTGATGVRFNGVNAASFNVVNDTTITAVAPSGVTSGAISVVGHVNTAVSSAMLTVTVNPVVADITGGNVTLCSGGTAALVSSTSAGTAVWSSSDEAVAHVDINTGVVTATGAGTATITYTATNGSCTAFKTTNITVNDAISITSFTNAQTVTPASDTYFSVVATGTGLTYQWYVSTNGGTNYNAVTNGGMYSGATTATLDLYGVGEEHNGYLYYVVITGTAPCAPVTSDVATLGVSDVGITTQPQAVVLCGSGNAEFTVVAEGTGLTYQWYVNQGSGPQAITNGTVGGITYSGATSATLNVANVSAVNNGWAYYVAVTDATMAEAISGVAMLTVNTAPHVTASPANNVVCYAGGTVNYSVTATGTGVSYQWQYATSASGPWTNVTDASPAGTTYSGASTASLSVTTTASTPVETYYYRAVVSGVAPCSVPAESAAATLTFFTPQITTQPANASSIGGNSATFNVVTSAPSPSYQWQYATSASGPWSSVTAATPAGTTYSGDTSATLTVNTNSTAAGSYFYRVIVTSGGCSINSNSAQLTVTGYCVGTFSLAPSTDYMSAINIAGTTLAAAPAANSVAPYYTLLTGANNTATMLKGYSYTASVTVTTGGTQGVGVWIDLNDDGDFADTNEFLGNVSGIAANGTGNITFTIPATATPGLHRMRFRNIRATTVTSGLSCTAVTGRGSTIDFNITVGTGTAPVVTSFTPSTYCAANGVITITGTDFAQATLKVGATTITPITLNPEGTQITATVNAGVSGVVAVTTPAGTFTTTETFAVTLQPALTLSASSGAICPGGTTGTVTLTAGGSDYTSFNWSSVPSGAAVSGTSGTGYTFSPTENTVYTLTATNAAGCTRTATYTVTVNDVPTAIAVSPSSPEIYGGQATPLTVTGGLGQMPVALGAGTTTNTTSSYPAPYTNYYGGVKHQMLIRASELTALGFTAGSSITKIAFNVTAVGNSFSGTLTDFRIDMGHTANTVLTATAFISGLSNVFPVSNVAIPTTGLPTNVTHTFTTPFTWNGTDNVVIQTSYSNSNTGNVNTAVQMTNSDAGFVSTNWYRADGATSTAVFNAAAPTSSASSSSRPNMIITGTLPATITWSPSTGLSATTGRSVSASPSVTTTYTITATTAAGCVTTQQVTVTVKDKDWTGAVSTDWNTAGNWAGGIVPTASDNVVIPNVPNKPIISGNIVGHANTLKIESGTTLTVKSGNSIVVTGAMNIIPQNGLVVENYAAVKQIDDVANTGAGSATVHRNSSKLFRNDYTLWSSPVQGQGIFQFSPNTLSTRFYSYNTASDQYNAIPGLSSTSTTTFAAGESYLIRLPDAQKVGGVATGTFVPATLAPPGQDYNAGIQRMIYNGVYKGKPNNGTISVAVNTGGNGYNAIGNPYPSPISISQFFAENGNNTDGTIYVWRKKNATEGSAYCTITADGEYNGNLQPEAENPNGLLQTGQGFIVKALGPIVFNNNMRQTVTVVDSSFFRSPVLEAHRIRLNLYKGTKPVGQMLVAYKNNATMGVDPGVDALYINDVNTSLNSMIGSTAYAIQGRALPFSNQDVVPLQFNAGTEGSFTISLAEVDGIFAGNQNVYLRDKLHNVIHDIKGGSYTFSTQIGTFDDRFDIVYTDSALGTDNPVLDPNSIVIYKNDNKLHIDSGVAVMKDIRIFDIRGRLVYEKTGVNATTAEVTGLSVQEEMLIVQVTTVDNAKVSKKVIY